jgi:biopolymer transport protein TolQ
MLGFVGAAMGGRLASLDTLSLIFQASWAVQLVLLILAGMSVLCWGIIAFKWRELSRARQDSEAFLEVYQQGAMDASYEAARDLDSSPLSAIFLAGYSELNRMARYSGQRSIASLNPQHVQAVDKQLQWAATREALRLERGMSVLATTGSAAPFIGLFGTVIGIINAFHNIGQAGSASLAVVAPGIAEALIATAIGLFAAIPATIFYNAFLGRLRELTSSIDVFTSEYAGDLQRLVAQRPEAPRAARG